MCVVSVGRGRGDRSWNARGKEGYDELQGWGMWLVAVLRARCVETDFNDHHYSVLRFCDQCGSFQLVLHHTRKVSQFAPFVLVHAQHVDRTHCNDASIGLRLAASLLLEAMGAQYDVAARLQDDVEA